MELKYKPILDDFDEDIAVPIGDWTKETLFQLSALSFSGCWCWKILGDSVDDCEQQMNWDAET